MITFKLIRKIGKMLRGGAGKREIFLGALCGVLIGFNPVAGLTLGLAILLTLLLNANIGFTLLGIALGKVCALLLSVVSFHTGYFLIHNVGLEGVFASLANAPVVALMNLDVYAMIGSLPFSLIIGIAFGKSMAATITKIREQMVKAGGHEKVGKAVGNKFSRFLLWLAFGKQKVSTEDVLEKESPLLRKSGVILVAVVLVIGFLLEFFLADIFLKKSLEKSIAAGNGAEVNIDKVHFSLGGGEVEIINLQVTDADKPTHNRIQIETLTADLSVSDLLRRTYTIDLLSGSVLKRDVPRTSPGKVYIKEKKADDAAEEKPVDAESVGESIDKYLVKAETWKRYGEKVHNYLKEREARAEAKTKGEKPAPSRERAMADAKKLGYLKARADLVTDRPAWTIRRVEIDQVDLGNDTGPHKIEGSELSSHPEMNGLPTTLALTPQDAAEPIARVLLRFDDPSAAHEIFAHIQDVELGDAIKTDAIRIDSMKTDIKADGTFSTAMLEVPFTLAVRELKTDNDTLNNLKNLNVPGTISGSLLSPRIKVDLNDQMKDAVVDAAKEQAKEEAKKAANKELDKAMQSEEAEDLKKSAGESLKKLF